MLERLTGNEDLLNDFSNLGGATAVVDCDSRNMDERIERTAETRAPAGATHYVVAQIEPLLHGKIFVIIQYFRKKRDL